MSETFIDYYEVLEVHPKASQEVIQNAYRALAKKLHPDINNSAQDKMVLLNKAYEILSDINKRKEYDEIRNKHLSSHKESNNNNIIYNEKVNDYNDKCNRIINCCNAVCEYLNIAIVREDNYILNNIKGCTEAHRLFSQKVEPNIETISINKTMNHELAFKALDNVAITAWRLASAYTWAQEFETAEKLMSLSMKYARTKSDYFPNLKESYINISKNADRQRSNKTTKKNNISSYIPTTLIAWVFIIIVLIVFSSVSGNSTKKQPVTTNPATAQQVPQKNNIKLPNPKDGVKTQYVAEKPLVNNTGGCQIKIDNTKNSFPVYVRIWSLKPQPKPVRTFTIKQGEQFSVEDLNTGTYEIHYAQLYENENSKYVFKSDPFTLEEKTTNDGMQYSVLTFTLYKVNNGNAEIHPIVISEL